MKLLDFKIWLLNGMMLMAASCSDSPVTGIDLSNYTDGLISDEICFMVKPTSSPSRGGSSVVSRRADGTFIYADKSDSLYMSLTVSDMNDNLSASRASYITKQDINTLMMTCRTRTADGAKYYFSNTAFTYDGTVWSSVPDYWWQNDASLHYNFYGYAPAEIAGATFSEGTDFYPTLEYTVPTDVTKQTDIVYNALTQEYISSENKTVPVRMDHALATISFVCGTDMIGGTINSVTIRGVNSHGILSLKDGSWSGVDTPADFTAATGTASNDNAEITSSAANTLFMLIPQTGTPSVDINFTTPDGKTRTYSGTIQADWQAGNQYRYTITLNPDLTIDLVPETQDAHYIIAKTHVSAENLQAGQSWELSVSANDGANVTLLNDADLNSYQRQGFWIDEIVNGTTHTNARGTASVTGSAPTDVYIFLPENVSDNNRTITLTLKMGDKVIETKTFEQYHPAWTTDGFGWEQIDDSRAQFGFDWNYVVCYAYLYTAARSSLDSKNETYQNYLNSIIEANNATGYADVVRFNHRDGLILGWRYYIRIDYSKLSSLAGYTNGNDGLVNTRDMNIIAGSAVTNEFEKVVANIKKVETDHENENTFRKGNGAANEAPAPTGDPITSSPAIGDVLKKNRYYIKVIVDDSGNPAQIPTINESDIVWYMPAVAQFSSIPTDIATPVVPGDCWSSNADTSSNGNAYLGNNSLASRKSEHNIRACRNRH